MSIRQGVWPVPISQHHGAPVVSDGFGRTKRGGSGHLGIDIMYKRPTKGVHNPPEETPWFRMPHETPALACKDGTIWSVEQQGPGIVVRIDHGYPWLSVYRHIVRALVVKGDNVRAGEAVGTIGHDPRNPKGINHLHFELWDTSIGSANTREARSIDPAPYMVHWDKVGELGEIERGGNFFVDVDSPEVDPGLGSALEFATGKLG